MGLSAEGWRISAARLLAPKISQGNPDTFAHFSHRFCRSSELQVPILFASPVVFFASSLRVNAVQQSLPVDTDLTG
jgi:hypothetical protein